MRLNAYIFILLLAVSGYLGWMLRAEYFAPDIIIRQDSVVVVSDTLKLPPVRIESPRITVNVSFREVIAVRDTQRRINAYTDSVIVKNDSADFKAKVTVRIKDGESRARFNWNVFYKPIIFRLPELIRRDSISYKTELIEIAEPFYKNSFFYTTLSALLFLALAIIR